MTKQERHDWGWEQFTSGATLPATQAARERFDFVYDAIGSDDSVEAALDVLKPILRIQGQAADLAAKVTGASEIGPKELDASSMLVSVASDTSFCGLAIDKIMG